MDPNANLARQQELLADAKDNAHARYELHDLRMELSLWLTQGGFAPAWELYREATAAFQRWSRR